MKILKENPIYAKFSLYQIFYSLSVGILIPFLSIILKEANWSIEMIAYFFAISSFVAFLFGPVVGKVADDIGKKKLMLFGLILQIITFILYYFFIENKILSLIIRGFDVLSYLLVWIIGISVIEDLIVSKRGFWTGFFMSIRTIGALLGPILAGVISDHFSNRLLFLVGSTFTFLAFLALYKISIQKEGKYKKITKKELNPLFELKDFLSHTKLKGMALLGILMNSKGQVFVIFFPILIVEQLGFSKTTLGFLLAIPAVLHLFQIFFGKIVDKISSEFGVLLGVFLASSAVFFLPYATSLISIIIILFIYGIGGGMWNVNAWVLMGEIGKNEKSNGEIVGSYLSLSKLGVFFTTLISASLISFFGITQTLQLFAIIILVGNFIAYFFFRPVFHHEKHGSMFRKINIK